MTARVDRDTGPVLIVGARLPGCSRRIDLRCEQGVIAELAPTLRRRRGELVIEADGGALLPGLHDHHIHLLALAARRVSVHCGPPSVNDYRQLCAALRADTGSGWLRGTGYHESVAGDLDRRRLDAIVRDRPLKIQHRSGKLWMVNSLAAERLALPAHTALAGVELDSAGVPNGRLYRLDNWMRAQSDAAAMPPLGAVSRLLASFGVTGVTDATPDNDDAVVQHLARSVDSGELLQDVRVMGGAALPAFTSAQLRRGERKVLLDEDRLPAWHELCDLIYSTHGEGRALAFHCVTPTELVLVLSALRATGARPGDRIEHASLVPDAVLPLLREVGARVVTQPGFIHERGDQYLREIAPDEHSSLYRCGTLLDHGLPLAGSTDAPYGDPDPWAAMRAAVTRRTRGGAVLGAEEVLSPEQAVALFCSRADEPGGASRPIAVGEVADLCLLDRRWEQARLRLLREDVVATLRHGAPIHLRDRWRHTGVRHACIAG